MTCEALKAAFELNLAVLPLKSLLPVKQITETQKASRKFRTIAQSLAEVGLIEPLVVFHKPDGQERYLLLDGHLRRHILLQAGVKQADCILATDDEAYTYNKQVTRLGVVQEHLLILRAIERGVPEARIAKALGVNMAYIRQRRSLLVGITPRAATLLKDKVANPTTFNVLRKLRPSRQIEACELMIAGSNFSLSYARAILAASSDEQRVKPKRRNRPSVTTAADLALMNRELQSVRSTMNKVEASYGHDMLDLVVAARYVSRLLDNRRIVGYLDDNHPEMVMELRKITSTVLRDPPPEKLLPDAPPRYLA
jgi:ParB-like chromosome segregation protein Spo0J